MLDTHNASSRQARVVGESFVLGAHPVDLAFEVYVIKVDIGSGLAQLH